MDQNQLINKAKAEYEKALAHFTEELKKLRTGRAHPGMLDGVTVQAYGTPMPLIQVANITVPEAQLIQITPFDPSNLAAISQAIRDNPNLGLNPMDDGRVVRVPVPALNEERRRELAKNIGEKMEEAMIAMRNARHDALREAEAAKKAGKFTEDDLTSTRKQLDDELSKQKAAAEAAASAKEKEIMTV